MRSALARLASLWRDVSRRGDVERDLDDELQSYVELLAAEKIRDGLSPDAARRAARAEVGSVDRVKEQVRATRADRWIFTALPDLRLAWRALRRSPGFALVAVATLALGVGGTTGVFAIVDAALLRGPAGVRESERLVTLVRVQGGETARNFGHPDYRDFRDQARTLDGLAAYRPAALSVRATAAAELVRGMVVSGTYFGVLGARTALGRTIAPADDRRGAPPVAVLAHAYWQRVFGGDPRAIGATVWINAQPFTVVGVADARFDGALAGERADVWIPLAAVGVAMPNMSAGVLDDRTAGWLSLVGRLRANATPELADVELRGIARRLAAAYPGTNAERSARVLDGAGLYPSDRAEVGNVLGMLGGAVALLLVVTCVNVAGLMLVRSAARRREVAARLALGATRGRLARLLLAEGLVVAALAAGPAVLVAWLVARGATALQPGSSILAAIDVTPDARLLGVALALATATGALVALVPAVRVSRVDPASVLQATSSRAGGGRSRTQRALVVLQVALSAVLLVVAGLTVGTVRRALGADPGYDPANVAIASIDLGMQGYDATRGAAFYAQLLERLRAEPGLEAASMAKTMPPRDWSDRVSIFTPGTEPPMATLRAHEYDHGLQVRLNRVAPQFFETLGISLLRGRDFTTRDDARSAGVAIVSARLARRLWPSADPIGQRISWPTVYVPDDAPARPPLTVVGIAADMRYLSLTDEPPLLMYVPVLQEYDARATIAVRAQSDPAQAAAAITRAVRELEPSLPVTRAQTMRRHMENSLWRQRTTSTWVLAFGALAVLLTALGLYGVTAQSVAHRARELSVRLALGAAPVTVARGVLRESLTLAAVGLALGIPAALGATRLVRAAVAGVEAPSGPYVALAVAVVAAVTLAACAAPARRAARANPADALRAE